MFSHFPRKALKNNCQDSNSNASYQLMIKLKRNRYSHQRAIQVNQWKGREKKNHRNKLLIWG